MQIADKMAVSIHYTLTNEAGDQLDSSIGHDPLTYLHGQGNVIPGLENALLGKRAGDKFSVTVAPDEAYGERKEDMVQVVPKTMFEGIEKIEVGMEFQADTNHGVSVVSVSKIEGDDITIDGNHPLSGETLTFDGEIIDIRPATEDELAHKHIHGAGCNH